MSLRVIFMGTPDFAVPALAEILDAGHEVVAAYSQPPRPAGRGMAPKISPVQAFAEKSGIPAMTPAELKSQESQDAFQEFGADVAVVAAYGLILPKPILEAPRHGCLNLHASLLPRWRGAAPIQRAIMAGDRDTGVMVMRMAEGLDTGPICLAERCSIGVDQTAGELHDVLARLGADLMVRALVALERGSLDCVAQPEEGVTYADKIDKDETRIDWRRPADEVHNHIRGLAPWPGAWFELKGGGRPERIKALASTRVNGSGTPGELLEDSLKVACGEGAVRLLRVQRAGKKPMEADEFLRGSNVTPGAILE